MAQTTKSERGRILNVGEVAHLPSGDIFSNWFIDCEGRDVYSLHYSYSGKALTIGGWPAEELHAMSHGVPCRYVHSSSLDESR